MNYFDTIIHSSRFIAVFFIVNYQFSSFITAAGTRVRLDVSLIIFSVYFDLKEV